MEQNDWPKSQAGSKWHRLYAKGFCLCKSTMHAAMQRCNRLWLENCMFQMSQASKRSVLTALAASSRMSRYFMCLLSRTFCMLLRPNLSGSVLKSSKIGLFLNYYSPSANWLSWVFGAHFVIHATLSRSVLATISQSLNWQRGKIINDHNVWQ